jgi:hypothetical protein
MSVKNRSNGSKLQFAQALRVTTVDLTEVLQRRKERKFSRKAMPEHVSYAYSQESGKALSLLSAKLVTLSAQRGRNNLESAK